MCIGAFAIWQKNRDMVNCPITNSTHVKLIEKIEAGKIEAYYDLFGIETRDAFRGVPYVLKYHSITAGTISFIHSPFRVLPPFMRDLKNLIVITRNRSVST